MFNPKLALLAISLTGLFVCSSFSQSTLLPDVKARIEAQMPKPLPQEPVVDRETTDAFDQNLRGQVKSVIEEMRSLASREAKIGKRMSEIAEFDKKGNFTRRVYFEYRGVPVSLIAYGYLDGSRISKEGPYDDQRGMWAAPRVPQGPPNPPTQPRDDRYTYKYVYRYKNGRLAEMKMIHNDGSRGMRYEYSHSPKERSETAFDSDGEINAKHVYNLDDRGNEIDRTTVDVRKVYDGNIKYRFIYQSFDSQGNWTKRTLVKIEAKGKTMEEPAYEEFRTITYY